MIYPKEVMERMHIKEMEVVFETPKKMLVRYDPQNSPLKDELLENVTSIDVDIMPFVGTMVNLHFDTEMGERTIETQLEGRRQIFIMDN